MLAFLGVWTSTVTVTNAWVQATITTSQEVGVRAKVAECALAGKYHVFLMLMFAKFCAAVVSQVLEGLLGRHS